MASKRIGASALPKTATSSPVTQTLQQTKPKSPPPSSPPPITLKDLQDALLQTAKQIRVENEAFLEKKLDDLQGNIAFILTGFAEHADRIEGRVDELVENVEGIEDRVVKLEDGAENIQNDIVMSQYRDMEFALRIRGLREDIQEKLGEEIAADLAVALACSPEEILRDMEKVYRVNSWVARQRGLPRDVVIYFSRRTRCNEIIQAFYQQRFQIAAQEVIILKEIPSKILRRRKDFAFLSQELKKWQIPFRWDIPVGIVMSYLGIRYRLNTLQKAKDFF